MPDARRSGPVAVGRSIVTLVRWENALIAAGGVLVGALWARSTVTTTTLWCVFAAVGFTVFANAGNDLRDEAIDRVAHPDRPLPRGELSKRAAGSIAAMGAVVAIAASVATGLKSLIVAAPVVLLAMLAYNRWLSRAGIAGNVVVAVLASLPFAYGAASVAAPRVGFALAAIAAPLHLAREVAKDIDDARGDAPFRRTLGTAAPPWLARGAVLAAIAIFVYGAAQLGRVAPRLPVLLVPAFVLCALAVRRVVAGRSGAPLLFKLAMIVSMAALLVARRPLPTE